MQVIMYLKIKSRGKCVLLKVINDLAATISMIRLKETAERPRIRGSAGAAKKITDMEPTTLENVALCAAYRN